MKITRRQLNNLILREVTEMYENDITRVVNPVLRSKGLDKEYRAMSSEKQDEAYLAPASAEGPAEAELDLNQAKLFINQVKDGLASSGIEVIYDRERKSISFKNK